MMSSTWETVKIVSMEWKGCTLMLSNDKGDKIVVTPYQLRKLKRLSLLTDKEMMSVKICDKSTLLHWDVARVDLDWDGVNRLAAL